MSNLLDAANEKDGGSLIGYVTVALGYKVVATGPQQDSFFTFSPKDKASQEKALNLAREFAKTQPKKLNAKTNKEEYPRPNRAIMFKVHKATVKSVKADGANAADGWKGDRVLITAVWTNVFKVIIAPAIEKLNLESGDYWMEMGYAPDPDGRMKKDQNGEEKLEFHPYPVAIFQSEAEAEAASGTVADAGDGQYPPKWDKATWDASVPEFIKLIKVQKKSVAEVAAGYGIPASYLEKFAA